MQSKHLSILFSYFNNLSDTQKEQFERLGDLYKNWNSKINVISRKDIDELYIRHILHSLGIAKVFQFKKGQQVLDVGTGGGFPGIPLAILYPEISFLLVDSIGKKIHVVNEICRSLGLHHVKGMQSRVEQIDGKFDVIVSRAVTRMKPFYDWVKTKLKPEGQILYLKGGNIEQEMKESGLNYKEYPLKDFFIEPFFETKKVVRVID